MTIEKIINAWQTAKDFGFKWTAQRLYYEFQLRSGSHRRKFPKRAWGENEIKYWLKQGHSEESIFNTWLLSSPRFFFSVKKQKSNRFYHPEITSVQS